MLGYDLWGLAQQNDNENRYLDISHDEKNMGVIPRSMKYLFSLIRQKPNISFRLSVSYIEIYNEKLIDLLNNNINNESSEKIVNYKYY